MKTALITGASQGLGAALMTELAAQGVAVVGVARGREALDEVVQQVRQRGGEAHGIVADVATDSGTIALQAAGHVGPIDLLINNASTLGPTPLRGLSDLSAEDFERVIQVNLSGPFQLTRQVVGNMSLRGGGSVVFISSDAAVEAYPTWGAYAATKAAADHMARVWQAELPALRILSIDPGEMNTAMHAAAMPEADPNTLQTPRDAALRILASLEAS